MKDYTIQKKSSNHIVWRLAALVFFLVALVLTGFFLYINLKATSAYTESSSEQVFDIEKGEGLSSIAQRLEEKDIISSAFVLQVYARMKGLSSSIQAGSFLVDSSMSMREVLDQLASGRGLSDEIVVTLKEGTTVAEMAEHLETAGLFSAEDFLGIAQDYPASEFAVLRDRPARATLEGYLFPDTYNFKKDATTEEVLDRLLENFSDKLTETLRLDIARSDKTVFEIVIMASIIEAEVGRNKNTLTEEDIEKLKEERRLVAGVFYNRLDAGHLLQSDATLGYATGQKKRQLSPEDVQNPSVYNTYQHLGLPPGPINNPSLDAIMAAIYPADTEYFYFLSKQDGEAVFGRTLEEHNENKAEYLR